MRVFLGFIILASCERSPGTGPDEVSTGILGRVTCVRERGNVACQGPNPFGTLGDGGALEHSNRPLKVQGPVDVKQVRVSPGETFVCALGQRGTWCWGDGSILAQSTGQPGRAITRPGLVAGLPPVHEISVGFGHACALDRGGAAFCWGDNLGSPIADVRDQPIRHLSALPVLGIKFRELAAGVLQSCGVTVGNDLYCWGGAIPDGDSLRPVFSPTLVLKDVEGVFVSKRGEMCARLPKHREQCWTTVSRETDNAHEARRAAHAAQTDTPP